MNVKAFIYKREGAPRLCNMDELKTLGSDEIFAFTIDVDDSLAFLKLYLNFHDIEWIKGTVKLWCTNEVQTQVFKEITDYLYEELNIAESALEACEFGAF